jgi:DNA-binding NarL/FixJ family response regulator
MSQTIRIALVNDYEIVLEGLRALLRAHEPEIRVAELGRTAVAHARGDSASGRMLIRGGRQLLPRAAPRSV